MTNSSSRTMSIDEFDSALDAMIERGKAHLTAIVGSGTARSSSQATHAESLEISQAVKDIIKIYCEDPMLGYVEKLADEVSVLAQDAKDRKITPDAYDRQLDDLANKTVQQFTKDQGNFKEKLKEVGHDHPDQANGILEIFNKVSDFILGPQGYQKILNFLIDTVKMFVEWAGKILGWFKDVIGAITSFFARLF